MTASTAWAAAKRRHPWLPSNLGGVATKLGMSLEEYLAHLDRGEKWCTGHKAWHRRAAFGRDAASADGLGGSCRVAKNGHPDHATPTGRPRGRRYVEARDGDEVQARARVNRLVVMGLLPRPNTRPCVDCRHVWSRGERRHEYDHHRGYAPEHHDDVEVVCTRCHYARETERGASGNARRAALAGARQGEAS